MSGPIDAATRSVAPMWPLDRWIAVNPLWGLTDRSFGRAAADVARWRGVRWLPDREWLHHRLGSVADEVIGAAAAELGASALTPAAVRHQLVSQPRPAPKPVPTLADLAGAAAAVERALADTCASVFADAAAWATEDVGLLQAWFGRLHADPELAAALGVREISRALPSTEGGAEALILRSLAALTLHGEAAEAYCSALLWSVHGWASLLAWRRWEARLAGRDDDAIVTLLAARIAVEVAVLRGGETNLRARWQAASARWEQPEATPPDTAADRVAQLAIERDAEAALLASLRVAGDAPSEPPTWTAAFCIDVRSERLRRHLERVDPSGRTVGVAGFFGAAIAWQPDGAVVGRPMAPGLVAADALVPTSAVPPISSLAPLAKRPLTMLPLVESGGLLWLWELARAAVGARAAEEPTLPSPQTVTDIDGQPLGVEARAARAAGLLRGAGLVGDLGEVLVLVGHGASSANNPAAASLQCGACGGQRGELNARVVASWLRDPAVRQCLAERHGVRLGDTLVVGALHDTTTDRVRFFDLEALAPADRARVERLAAPLEAAGDGVRRERAPSLGLDTADPARLARLLRRRGADPSEVRPEWGLAGNAAMVIGPRWLTRGVDLRGRVFLHDHDPDADPDGAALTGLLTAPLVVAHWINAQYYASVVDPERLGSGDKVLHDVVGGHLGVVEGAGGDLRVGLARQSVHDGRRWMHEPLRLAAVVFAPKDRIASIIAGHEPLRNLLAGRWMTLYQLDPGGEVARWSVDGWQRAVPPLDASAAAPPSGDGDERVGPAHAVV